MELHDFLERHSTEYSRRSEGMKYFKDEWRLAIAILLNSDSNLFDEALANYTDLICKKQREECALSINNVECFGRIEAEATKVIECILNAPQPKPEKP